MTGRTDIEPDFDRLGDLLGGTLEATASVVSPGAALKSRAPGASPPTSSQDPARLLVTVWQDVVGPEVAANAHPVQLKKGLLVVSASSSVWAQTLQFMGEDIVLRLGERLGPGVVERVAFRHAGWEERPRDHSSGGPVRGESDTVVLSEEQRDALDRIGELDLPREVREQIARAMRAAFVRAQQGSVR